MLQFSLPPPLGTTVKRISAPGTISVCTTAGVLSLLLTRSKGSLTTDLRMNPSA